MKNTKYLSFKKARDFVLKLNLKNQYEWAVYCHISKLKPENIPHNPDAVYKKWQGWKHWLGNNDKVPFLPFNEARKLVRSMNFKNTIEFKKWCNWNPNDYGLKPPNIPASPHLYYSKEEWKGYADWLGTEHNIKVRAFRSFEDARKFARTLGLTSSELWIKYCQGHFPHLPPKPRDIPVNVARKYHSQGFAGMNDFLNAKEHRRLKRLNNVRPFEEARAFVHSLNIRNLREWHQYVKGNLPGYDPKPNDIPNSPDLIYKGEGWNGYGDWFGTYTLAPFKRRFRSFESAREFARKLGITSSEKWIQYCKGKMPHLPPKPKDIPTNVARKYRDEGWKGYKDFLNSKEHRKKHSKFLPYDEAKKFVHKLKLQSYKEWHRYVAGDFKNLPIKPKNIPANPAGVYKNNGWIGIGDWIGTDAFPYAHLEYRKFSEARAFARKLGLTSSVEWVAYCKGEFSHLPEKPLDIPANVVRKYENKGWKGFKDFLWSDRHRNARKKFVSYEQAKLILKENNIKTLDQLGVFLNSVNKPDTFPKYPQMAYQRKGWISFEEFLK